MYMYFECKCQSCCCCCADLTVFGVPLETAIQRSLIATDSIELPTIFRLCIDYLEENGTYMYLY